MQAASNHDDKVTLSAPLDWWPLGPPRKIAHGGAASEQSNLYGQAVQVQDVGLKAFPKHERFAARPERLLA